MHQGELILKFLINFIILFFSSFVYAQDVKVEVFGKEMTLPEGCVVYARPSVLNGEVRYICNEPKSEIWVIFTKFDKDEFDKYIAEGKAKVVRTYKGITHYVLTFHAGNANEAALNVACDMELCFSIPGKQSKIFKELLGQVAE